MKKTKVGIVGYGYVGKAMSRFFASHYDVVVWDPAYAHPMKILPPAATEHTRNAYVRFAMTKESINDCDVAIVAVPTSPREDGSCDVSLVEEAVQLLDVDLIIVKSTVEPGTVDRLKKETGKNIVFSPEYCGESSYWTPYAFHTDVKETPFFIFGGDPKDTSACIDLYAPIVGPTKIYRQTTALAAEIAKYIENTFYATKILFCYEIKQICDSLGTDYNEARELWLLDPRLNPMHTSVFKDNDLPFSGKCFPKDLSALIAASEKSGYDPKFLKEVKSSNARIGALRAALHGVDNDKK